jgi:hypothetical protein
MLSRAAQIVVIACAIPSAAAADHLVSTGAELFDKISNWEGDPTLHSWGNDIITGGDTVTLAPGTYVAGPGAMCSSSSFMCPFKLSGTVECAGPLSCTLDGQGQTSHMWIEGTGSSRLTFRGLVFANGHKVGEFGYGGSTMVQGGVVRFEVCRFSNNHANVGGAVFLANDAQNSHVVLQGVEFSGNQADDTGHELETVGVKVRDVYVYSGDLLIKGNCPEGFGDVLQGSAMSVDMWAGPDTSLVGPQ